MLEKWTLYNNCMFHILPILARVRILNSVFMADGCPSTHTLLYRVMHTDTFCWRSRTLNNNSMFMFLILTCFKDSFQAFNFNIFSNDLSGAPWFAGPVQSHGSHILKAATVGAHAALNIVYSSNRPKVTR